MVHGDIQDSPLLCLGLAMVPLGLAIYGTTTGIAVLRSAKVYRAKNPFQYWLLLVFEYAAAGCLIGLFIQGEFFRSGS